MEFERKKQWERASMTARIGYNKEQGQGFWGQLRHVERTRVTGRRKSWKLGHCEEWICKEKLSSAPVMTTRNSEGKVANL